MKIFNTLTQKKETFIPRDPNRVRIYNCGPTVYNYNHIGNFRSYIFVDLLRRYLKFRGYQLEHTSNITDIDDKIIQNAIKENKSIYEFTQPYIQAFFEDLKTLRIEPVEHRPYATKYIDQMIELMKNLEKNGHTYVMDGNVYYKIHSFKDYGKLSHIDKIQLMAGASQRFDVDEYTKEDIRDFALWKKPVHEKEPRWQSPWGKGRPGWHLECSAMIRGIYGKDGVDIHIGGVDLIFPHHENEIAQSKGAYPSDNFVRYWMHNEHLLVNGKKMSKSLGNFYTLRELISLEKADQLIQKKRAPEWLIDYIRNGWIARAIRFVLLATHYRQKLNFTFEQIQYAHQVISKVQNTIIRCMEILQEVFGILYSEEAIKKEYQNRKQQDASPIGKKNESLVHKNSIAYIPLQNFIEGMDDDLNISKGIAALFDLVHNTNQILDRVELEGKKEDSIRDQIIDALIVFYAFNTVFALFDFELETRVSIETNIKKWIEEKIQERAEARKNKDFKKADAIRDELSKKGIVLMDTPAGTKWKIKT